MFDDVFFTPLSTHRLIDLTHRVIDLGFSGILNICGGERISNMNSASNWPKSSAMILILFSLFRQDGDAAMSGVRKI